MLNGVPQQRSQTVALGTLDSFGIPRHTRKLVCRACE
jgi:hypothetical protein